LKYVELSLKNVSLILIYSSLDCIISKEVDFH
jgi:hypothetical protein